MQNQQQFKQKLNFLETIRILYLQTFLVDFVKFEDLVKHLKIHSFSLLFFTFHFMLARTEYSSFRTILKGGETTK